MDQAAAATMPPTRPQPSRPTSTSSLHRTQLADRVEALLADPARLAAVGRAAAAKARSWTEHDNAAALVGHVRAALAAAAAARAGA